MKSKEILRFIPFFTAFDCLLFREWLIATASERTAVMENRFLAIHASNCCGAIIPHDPLKVFYRLNCINNELPLQ